MSARRHLPFPFGAGQHQGAALNRNYFYFAMNFTGPAEGGWADHPADPGGATNYGVSLRWLRSLGEAGDIDGDGDVDVRDLAALTRAQVEELFFHVFWVETKIRELPMGLAAACFDLAVHAGGVRAIKILQAALNGCGHSLLEDGLLGPKTMSAVAARYSADCGEQGLIEAVLFERLRFYAEITGANTKLQAFLRGWVLRVLDLRSYLLPDRTETLN